MRPGSIVLACPSIVERPSCDTPWRRSCGSSGWNGESRRRRLGFLAKLHPTYISMLENGRKSPTVDALERIAWALGVKVSAIFAGAEQSCGRSSSDE